jgi:hypothetical protein
MDHHATSHQSLGDLQVLCSYEWLFSTHSLEAARKFITTYPCGLLTLALRILSPGFPLYVSVIGCVIGPEKYTWRLAP